MDINQIEELISQASNGNEIIKINATKRIEIIKNNQNKWSIGLELFYHARNDISKLFGLTCKFIFFYFFLFYFFDFFASDQMTE